MRWFWQSGGSGPQLVQFATVQVAAATTMVAVLPAAPKVGNFLVLAFNCTASNTATPTQTGVTWASSGSIGTNEFGSVQMGTAIAAGASASATMTFTSGRAIAVLMEFSGVKLVSPKDITTKTAGAGTVISTPVGLTKFDNELVIAVASVFAAVSAGSPTGGFTNIPGSPFSSSSLNLAVAWATPPAGSIQAKWNAASASWDSGIAAYFPA